jgi:hypothetical protein
MKLAARPLYLAFSLTLVGFAREAGATERVRAGTAASVSNGTHRVEVTSVEKMPTLFGNMRPRTPGAVYLMVNIKTDDRCFDADKNQSCFDPGLTPTTKSTLACGEIEIAGKAFMADGGGLIGGKLSCGFVVPGETSGKFTLRLKGYPDLGLEVRGFAGFPAAFNAKRPTVKIIYVPRRQADAIKLAQQLTELAVNVTPLQVEEWNATDHIGKIYYCPGDGTLAKRIAAKISRTESLDPTERKCELKDDPRVIVWVAR